MAQVHVQKDLCRTFHAVTTISVGTWIGVSRVAAKKKTVINARFGIVHCIASKAFKKAFKSLKASEYTHNVFALQTRNLKICFW